MNVHLHPELEAFVQQLVNEGLFVAPDAAVETALWLLKDQYELYKVKHDEMRKLVAVGIEQLDRGEAVEGEIVFSKLREKVQRHLGQTS